MINYRVGNIFEEDVEALVNSVNCVGVMGRGIALQFKREFPANYKVYRIACDRNEVEPGRMFVFETGQIANPHYIINFPTKRHWRNKSRLEDIKSGLSDLAEVIRTRQIRSIAIPPLGSDLGKLNWSEVRALIEDTLGQFDDLRAVIFEPGSAGASRPVKSFVIPKVTTSRAVLVSLMDRYLRASLDPFVTLLEIHKLMYFMQESGEPLRLHYEKGPYGPYARNLRHVLQEMEGYMINGYGDGGESPHKPLMLAEGVLEKADATLSDKPATGSRLDWVAELIDGFETSLGVELLGTVHWVAKEHPNSSDAAIVTYTHEWGDRKRQFTERQINQALKALRNNGFLPSAEANDLQMVFNFAKKNSRPGTSQRFRGM